MLRTQAHSSSGLGLGSGVPQGNIFNNSEFNVLRSSYKAENILEFSPPENVRSCRGAHQRTSHSPIDELLLLIICVKNTRSAGVGRRRHGLLSYLPIRGSSAVPVVRHIIKYRFRNMDLFGTRGIYLHPKRTKIYMCTTKDYQVDATTPTSRVLARTPSYTPVQ